MGDLIKVKKGLLADLPDLMIGEPALTTDEERFYVGGIEGNVGVAMKGEFDAYKADYTYQSGRDRYIFGTEHLSAWHKKIINADPLVQTITPLKIVIPGDSTMAGTGVTTGFRFDELLKTFSIKDGIPYLDFINTAVGGMAAFQYDTQGYIESDIARSPNLFILRWGINEPGFLKDGSPAPLDAGADFPNRRDENDFNTSLRSILTKIRALLPLENCSIVLMTPNSTYDEPNGRYSIWYEKINPIIRQCAIDFKCCFFDTYRLWYDSVNASDYMDSPMGDSIRHIHPNDVFNMWITSEFYNVILPKSFRDKFGISNFVNIPSTTGLTSIATPPSNYPFGISMHRCLDAPYSGTLLTFKSADNTVYQINFGFNASYGYHQITSRIKLMDGSGVGDAWGDFQHLETSIAPILQNSWQQFAPGVATNVGYFKNMTGMVVFEGIIAGGITTLGTLIFTLPIGYRPLKTRDFIVSSDISTTDVAKISINADGTVVFMAGVNTRVSLDQISFRTD